MGSEQTSTRVVAPIRVEEIPIDQIVVGHRYREDLGDIDGLKKSIIQSGLIHPIAVKETVDNKYQMMAGGRRIEACKQLGWTSITCNIYPVDLTQIERNVIELCENIDRKDMEYGEQVALTQQIHIAMQALHGEYKGGVFAKGAGHSLRDTAKMLGKSPATVSEDIKLAMAIEAIPELADAKDKNEAMKILRKMKKEYDVQKIASRIEDERSNTPEDMIKKKLTDSYIIGDFFERSKDIPDGSVDLVEVDTPFAIDLKNIKKDGTLSTMHYEEWKATDYIKKITTVMSECYRILNGSGWLIWWFAYEPWFEVCYQTIVDAGFKCNRVPAIWVKPTGQANNPDLYLASSHEPFFYARKGNAKIQNQGRANFYQFRREPGEGHPTRKPIEMMCDIYSTFVQVGSRIMVPFLGSGNGILAAHNIGCTAFGWDLSQEYKDAYTIKVHEGDVKMYSSYMR